MANFGDIYNVAARSVFDAYLYTGDSISTDCMGGKVTATFESKIQFPNASTGQKFREYFHERMKEKGYIDTPSDPVPEGGFESYRNWESYERGNDAVHITFEGKEATLKITAKEWLKF